MSALGVRRAVGSSRRQIFHLMRHLLQAQIHRHFFHIALSLVLLPLDNAILFVAVILNYLRSWFPQSGSRTRHQILQDERFYPKTVLVTGIDTPYGLRVARCCYFEGHRVIGADITDSRVIPGEGMSKAIFAYYRLQKPRYVSNLLDIVQREKVDIWIPCSRDVSTVEDAMAKQAIEGRTSCKCITLDSEFSSQWGRSELFHQYLEQNALPIVESHQVHSRDSIHRILHRSPTKVYHIRKTAAVLRQDTIVVLPKRTLSSTYTQVSEIQVSKDCPWVMQQYARLGEFIAELLLVGGHVTAITIRPANERSDWGYSPLNKGLATAIHTLMEKFASSGGSRATGHLSLQLMVDEELGADSVRYAVHIAGCTQGAAAVTHLLTETPAQALVDGYLSALSENAASNPSSDALHNYARTSITKIPSRRPSLYQTVKGYDVRRVLPALYPVAQQIDWALEEAGQLLVFLKDWRFSVDDPLPWWWHRHVFWLLRELGLILGSEAGWAQVSLGTYH
ncbi:hypothetical protein ASPCAL05747 [Aspergillus calidoustus]|uniref:Uncharacterized protein n=1 Tax=Aspergillus calidoustus TaxID=454130 RepID=A0A0U5FYL0_ASPCI|nr:hypothetical protein ASPCAL05747 [Aspergillus calidoustus]